MLLLSLCLSAQVPDLQRSDVDCADAHAAVAAGHAGCLSVLLKEDPAQAMSRNADQQLPIHMLKHNLDSSHCNTVLKTLLQVHENRTISNQHRIYPFFTNPS